MKPLCPMSELRAFHEKFAKARTELSSTLIERDEEVECAV